MAHPLSTLFEMQRKLDEHIIEKKPELKGQCNLHWKSLALKTEVAECCNEWRGFKKWSDNQAPRTKAFRGPFIDIEDSTEYNPLLEEFVDGLHFVLSIGIELDVPESEIMRAYEIVEFQTREDTLSQFNHIYLQIVFIDLMGYGYDDLLASYLALGTLLGFSWYEIEKAYFEKNAINHQRQEQGY